MGDFPIFGFCFRDLPIRVKAALSSCDPGIYGTHSTRLHTVRTGNITNEVMLGQYSFAPAEFVWTDIKLVNGNKFEAVDCDNNTISIDPAAFAPQYILSVYNFMYSSLPAIQRLVDERTLDMEIIVNPKVINLT